MADDVRIYVSAQGLTETINQFADLLNKINSANGSHVRIDTNSSLKDLGSVQNTIKSIRHEQIDVARKLATETDANAKKELRHQRDILGVQMNALKEVEKAYKGYHATQEKLQKDGALQAKAQREDELRDRQKQLDLQRQGALQAKAQREDARRDEKIAAEQRRREEEEEQARIQRAGASLEAIGRAFQVAGGAVNLTSQFAQGIGQSFSSMAGLFKTNFVDVAGKYISSMFGSAITGSMGAALNRADILNTFAPYMELAGIDNATAQEALNRVDLSIRGLPIGLDEAAQRLRRYQMFLGDVGQATNLTIGVQKAITAGGAPESMRQMAYMQLDRLITTGKLSTQRQWNSLIQGMGISVRFLAEELGHGEMNASQFVEALRTGEIPAKTFLEALMSLGEGTSDAAKKLDDALSIYKTTYESWMNNIQFAAKRGMANVINALSASLESSTGRTTIQYMELIRNTMNDMFSSAAAFVGSGRLTPIYESVGRLVEVVRGFSGEAFGSNFVNYFSKAIDLFTTLFSRVDGNDFAQFTAFATTIAGPLGKLFAAVSKGAPAMIAIFDRFKDFDFDMLVGKIIDHVERLANVFGHLLDIIPDDLMADLIAFGLVEGPLVANALGLIGGALVRIGQAYPVIHAIFGSGGVLASAASSGALAAAVAPVAGVAGAAGVGAVMVAAHMHQQQLIQDRADAFAATPTVGNVGRAINRTNYFRTNTQGRIDAAYAEGDIYFLQRLFDAAGEERKNLAQQVKNARSTRNKLWENLTDENYLSQKPLLDKAGDDLANSLGAWDTFIKYYENLGKKIYELKHAQEEAAAAAKSAYRSFGLDYSTEEFIEGVQKRQEDLTKTFKGEKDEPFDYAGYKEDRWNADKWIKDLENRVAAESEVKSAIENYENEIIKYANDPTAITALQRIYEMGDEAVVAYMSGTEAQRKRLRDSAFNIDSVANAAATQGEKAMEGVKAYQAALETGEMTVAEAAAALVAVMADPTKHTAFDEWLHAHGYEPEMDAGYLSPKDRKNMADMIVQHSGGVSPAYLKKLEEEAKAADEANKQTDEYLTELIDTLNEKFPMIEEKTTSGFEEVEAAFSGFGGKIDDASVHAATAVADFFDKTGEAVDIHSQSLLSKITRAISEIIGQLNRVDGVTVSDVGGLGAPGGGGQIVAMPKALGGLVYAANGMFIPVGTDTVPAMLTPGEYVQRKAAVDAFGKDFMDKVNALNIKGAINTLFHRYPTLAGMTYVANNSRSYDNHAAVHMTINNASQYYSQRIADRWVRAL